MVPSLVLVTVHPMWVQVDEKPLNVPAVGWVTTMCWSGRMTPLPTLTSEALTSTSPPVVPPLLVVLPPPDEDDGGLVGSEPLSDDLLSEPQATSTGTAAPAIAKPLSMVRR